MSNDYICPICGGPKKSKAGKMCRKCADDQQNPDHIERAMLAYQLHVVQGKTLEETGQALGGVTRERARALVAKARKIKEAKDEPIPNKQ